MPPADKHHLQYKRNRKVIDTLLSFNDPPFEWVVIVAYYAALQLVDMTIAQKSLPPPDGHKKREEYVTILAELRPIKQEYMSLQTDSWQARYQCIPFNRAKARASLAKLERIEKTVLR